MKGRPILRAEPWPDGLDAVESAHGKIMKMALGEPH